VISRPYRRSRTAFVRVAAPSRGFEVRSNTSGTLNHIGPQKECVFRIVRHFYFKIQSNGEKVCISLAIALSNNASLSFDRTILTPIPGCRGKLLLGGRREAN
jgi:hypothetical protein